jgi:hypothetical protein
MRHGLCPTELHRLTKRRLQEWPADTRSWQESIDELRALGAEISARVEQYKSLMPPVCPGNGDCIRVRGAGQAGPPADELPRRVAASPLGRPGWQRAIDMLVGNKVEPFDLTQVVAFVGFWIMLQALSGIKKILNKKSTN